MRIITTRLRCFLGTSLLLMAILSQWGCTKDSGIEAPHAPTSVTLNLMLPSPTTMQSYGIDEDRENEVIRLDVFILNEAGNVINNVGHQTIRSFSQSGTAITALVAIDRSVAKQRFYIIANGTDAMFSGGITTKAQLDALEIGSVKMPRQLFVMSAQSELLTVTDVSFANKFTFSLIRCVARMDMKLAPAVNNFKIKSVKVINARSGGYLYQKKDASGMVTVPLTSTMVSYDGLKMTLAEERGFASRLYAYENYNATASEVDKSTSVILGGEYAGSGVTTYYLVDIKDSNQKLQLLRNNRYDITINRVDGPGFDDEEDAQTGANANLHYTIEVWKQSDVDAEFDGTLYLGVSERRIEVSRDAFGGTIMVETNADSYTVSSPLDASDRAATWLSLSTTAKTINYTATTNYTGATRTAYFYVKAGSKLKIKVSVTQTYGGMDIVKLSTTSVPVPVGGTGTFPASTIVTLGRNNVTWTINPTITKFGDMSDWVSFEAGQMMSGTGLKDDKFEVKVKAAAMTFDSPSRSGVVQIDAKDNTSGVVEHYKFTVVQLNNTDVVIVPERLYIASMASVSTVALRITSNCTWTATFFNGDSHDATKHPSTGTQAVNFKFAKDITGATLYPDFVTDGKSWHSYTATGDDVLYIKFINSLLNTNSAINGYVEIRNDDTSNAVVCRVRLHQGDYQSVDVNGYTILDRNLGATNPGAVNRTSSWPISTHPVSGYRYQFGRVPDGYETVFANTTISAVFNSDRLTQTIPNSIPPYSTTIDRFLNPWSLVIAGNDSWMSVGSDTPTEQRTPGSFWDRNAVLSTAARDITKTNQRGVRTLFDPCPEGYRVPTALELKHIFTSQASDGPGYNQISDFVAAQNGRWILGSKDGVAKDVFFPAAGASIYYNNGLYQAPLSTSAAVGNNGSFEAECYYLSSSPAGTPDCFHYLFFDKNKVEMRNGRHPTMGVSYATGVLSVRCVKE